MAVQREMRSKHSRLQNIGGTEVELHRECKIWDLSVDFAGMSAAYNKWKSIGADEMIDISMEEAAATRWMNQVDKCASRTHYFLLPD